MIALQELTLRRLERAANTAIARVIAREPADNGKGAMLRLYHLSSPEDGMAGLTELWSGWVGGNSNTTKQAKYCVISSEKALRLALNHQRYRHITSFESLAPTFHQYQGAALLRAEVPDISGTAASIIIVSVSGLSAINDQRIGLLTIAAMEWDANNSIRQVVSLTQDSEYDVLLQPA